MKLSKRINNCIGIPALLFRMIGNIRRQKKFIRLEVDPEIFRIRSLKDGSLDEADIKKLRGYYGLAVPAVLGEAFAALHGKKMTRNERLCSTAQGAMTGLGDDFFDRQRLSDEGVRALVENPGGHSGETASEKLFLHFYNTALSIAPDPTAMQKQLLKVFSAQLMSKQQKNGQLSYEVLLDITMRKGAESVLFYRTAFRQPVTDKEERMLYALGGLMQLSNDIFDVYPDLQDGVDTLVTTAKKISGLRILFLSLLQMGQASARRSGYPKEQVNRFLDILSIGIFSRCLVCLDQLEKNEKRSGGQFRPGTYKRKDLVCDMDTALNKWRSVKYHIKYSK